MGPTWVLSAPDGPHVGPRNIAISKVVFQGMLSIDDKLELVLMDWWKKINASQSLTYAG